MIFLNPAILFGLFAASIPLLIHLLNLRKIKKVEFSTLAFLKEIQKTKIKKVKLKQWLLLLIRTLIILFLVSAFARPTLKSVSLGGISSAAKTSIVFILDNSMSMGYVSENGSYFNKSKKLIKRIAALLQEGDDVSLVTTTSPKPLFTRVKSLSHFSKRLSAVELTDAGGNIPNALLAGEKLLETSNNYNKEIYLFTDLQKSNFSKDKILKIFSENNIDKTISRKIKLYLFDMHKGQTNNTAITKFTSANQIFAMNKAIRFNAIVTNFSDKSVTNNVVSLFIDGKRSAQQSLNLNAGQSKQIMFETKLTKTGLVNAVVRLEDDKLDADNSRYFAIYVPKKIEVVIYTANPQNAVFLKAALQNNYNGNIYAEIKRPAQYSSLTTNENLVTIFIGSKGLNLNLLKNGKDLPKSLIIFPGNEESNNSFNDLIKAIGLPGSSSIVNLKNNYLEFGNVDLLHPVFYGLFSKNKNIKIESPFIHKYIKVLPSGSVKSIISLLDNSIFLGEKSSKKSKVLIFTVSPTEGWSNFPLKAIFAPLIERSVYYLSANNVNKKSYTAGSSIAINIKNNVLPNIRVMLPNGGEEYISTAKLKNKLFYKYYNTFEAGIYRFYSGKKLIDYASVNIDPIESQNKYSDSKSFPALIKKSGFEGQIFVINNYSNLKNIIAQSRYGTELWRLFLILAFAAAIIEMLVSRSSKKDLANAAAK